MVEVVETPREAFSQRGGVRGREIVGGGHPFFMH